MDCLECIKNILCKRKGIALTQKCKPMGEIKIKRTKPKLLKGLLNETEMQISGYVGLLQGNKLSNVDFSTGVVGQIKKMSRFLYVYITSFISL